MGIFGGIHRHHDSWHSSSPAVSGLLMNSLLTVFMHVSCCAMLCAAVLTVHRDVKPQNVMVSVRDKRVKLIDLGAAADLRLGINYVPNEYLLDPR